MIRIGRHIKEGFIGVFRHFALSFSSMSSMTVTLILMSIFLILNQNIIQITQQIEKNVSLYVQIEDETESFNIDTLQNQIKKVDGVNGVTFSSKHEELEFFIENRGEEGEELFGGFRGDENPFLDAFIININSDTSIQTIAEKIKNLDFVYNISYGGEATQTLMDVMENVRNLGFTFVIALGFVAIFLISNTIAATINSRNREISIMRTVGATNWYIRWPFIIEGIIIGLIGSVIPILFTIIGYTKLIESQAFNIDSMFRFVDAQPMVWYVSGILALSGAVIGAVGSLISVSRRLRWTR